MSKPDAPLIKSYVWHGDKCFYVSTQDRDSSSALGPDRYAETIVWDYDYNKRERHDIIFSDGASRGYIGHHLQICSRIATTGSPEEKEPT